MNDTICPDFSQSARAVGASTDVKQMLSVEVDGNQTLVVKKRRKPIMNAPLTIDEIYACCTLSSSGCLEWAACRNRKGYGVINRRGRSSLAHRWVLYLMGKLELSDSKKMVLHKCNNPPCVNPNHLYIGTERENTRDKINSKTHNFGEKVPQAKLKDSQIVEIFRLYKSGLTSTEIAKKFGVNKNTISAVLRRQTWRHIDVPVNLLCK